MGTRYYPNGEHYTGEFVANIRHGTGRYGPHTAACKLCTPAFHAICLHACLLILVACFENHGPLLPWFTRRFYFSNGDMYVGQWIDDRRTGRGTYFYATGDIFMGAWQGVTRALTLLYAAACSA